MKRVLIVDDALELGRLLQTVFLTLDPSLSIQVVPSAEEALLESTRQPLDLLVTDIRLPGISGFELVKRIRARHPAIKVLVISGLTDSSLAERAQELKVEGFFRKPLDMTSFINAARACLGMPPESSQNPARKLHTAPLQAISITATPPVPAQAAESQPPELLPDIVANFRQRLGAQAVFVLDERGHIVVQAGDVPALPLEEKWIGPVMAALNSGEKVARLLKDGAPQHVMAFPGKEFHLVLAPVENYALLVLLKPGHSVLRMALAVEEALDVQQPLGETLATIRRQAKPSVPEEALPPTSPLAPVESPVPAVPREPPAADPTLMDFEKLINKSAEEIKGKNADDFWDRLAAKDRPGTAANPEVISYDQARKLGLTPKEEK
jgi:CheY-like chemotaxis protein